MDNSISKEFNFLSLLRFAFPSIIMMVFMSLYTMIDGMFVSRLVGPLGLSAVNIVFPLFSIVIAIGVMLASGGSAVIARKLGEEKWREAKENFSFIILAAFIIGVVIMILGLVFLNPLLRLLGATDLLFPLCLDYGQIMLMFIPFAILQMIFEYFFVTAGKPSLALIVTVIGGVLNIVLDYIFIVNMNMGIKGAALATGIGMLVPALIGLIYFGAMKKSSLSLVKPKADFKVLLESSINGSSEMVSNLAVAAITVMFNILMLKFLGEDGVAAITIALYAQFILNAVFMGFSMGVSPIISYNYGSENVVQIKKLIKYSLIFIVSTSVVSFIAADVSAPIIALIFAPKDSNVYSIAVDGFRLFTINFLFAGVNIFASAMFTAFSNGKISAIISFMRTFVFISASLIILPNLFGVDGIWLSTTVAEFLSIILSIFFIFRFRKTYKYF